jgi:hypothetical protein
MLDFLKGMEVMKENKEMIYLDLDYAFNQCHQRINENEGNKKIEKIFKRAQIMLYAIMGLCEKAADLALAERDFELAKKYANKSFIDAKLKRNLWLKIAKEILKFDSRDPQKGVEEALKLLSEQNKEILRIDDLLPFFPDDTKVEILKDKLCDSLKSYNDRINNLKVELRDQSKNAEDLREKNRKSKNKFISVHPTQTCEICFTSLLKQTFYAFTCGHGFHRECLIEELETYETKNHMLVSKIELLRTFFGEIKAIQSRAEFLKSEETKEFDPQDRAMSWFTGFAKKIRNSIAPGQNEMSETPKLSIKDQRNVENIYSQIDLRLKEECYLCGDILLDSLDNDVAIDSDEEDKVKYMYYSEKNSWDIE